MPDNPDVLDSSTGRPAVNAVSLRDLVTEGVRIADANRLRLNRREVRRVVVQFVESGRNVEDLATYVLDYADPTGEQAARNVDAQRAAVR